VIENRPGAGSTIGIQAVVNAPADGYTLITISTSAVISAQYYKNLNFNLTRDIVPVCGIALEPLVMVVNPQVAAKTVPEFIANAKAKPGKYVMASVGNGTTPHMGGQLFMMMAGVEMLHVPYQGAAPALTDMLGGRADVMFEAMPTLVGHIREGKLRALGVGSATRSSVFPDVPTVGEFLPGYEANVWFGIGAPRQTPGDIVERLNREINAGLNDPALRGKVTQFGGTPLVGSSAAFEQLFIRDSEKWAKVVQAAGARTQ
jgi:tripartite-type tricarboxylate transporter receptor subunit TctC